MKKSTKGSLAAVSAAVLLLGGATSLAFWSDDSDVNGGTLTSGSITLNDVTCGGWKHDEDDSDVTAIVPGDNVYNDCETSLVLVGDHIGATLEIDPASLPAGALADELVATVELQDELGETIAAVTEEGTTAINAKIVVDFDGPTGTNASQTGTAVLDALTLDAVQTHETP